MVERKEKSVVKIEVPAEKIASVDISIQGTELDPDPLLRFHPAERAAKIPVREFSAEGRETVEGGGDILEVGEPLQVSIPVGAQEDAGILDSERVALATLFCRAEQVVEVGFVQARADLPLPESIGQGEVKPLVLGQPRTG